MTRRLVSITAAAFALLALALPASALARDRNHDRIPDRWERAHHLSLKVNQAARDQDRDGLKNLAEYRQHSDPRDADSDDDRLRDGAEVETGHDPADRDSDDDGRHDGEEQAGTVASFDGTTLTIALAGGKTLAAAVVAGVTEIKCEGASARSSTRGDDEREGSDEHRGSRESGGDEEEAEEKAEDEDSASGDCGVAALTAGAVVHEAEVRTAGGQAVFREVELRRAT